MDTVSLSNGLKALFGTSQSTTTNIPTCGADGTPAGNISVANLASVLGGFGVETKTVAAGTPPITITRGDNAGILFVAGSGAGLTNSFPGIYGIARTSPNTTTTAEVFHAGSYVESVTYDYTTATVTFSSNITRATVIFVKMIG